MPLNVWFQGKFKLQDISETLPLGSVRCCELWKPLRMRSSRHAAGTEYCDFPTYNSNLDVSMQSVGSNKWTPHHEKPTKNRRQGRWAWVCVSRSRGLQHSRTAVKKIFRLWTALPKTILHPQDNYDFRNMCQYGKRDSFSDSRSDRNRWIGISAIQLTGTSVTQ